MYSFVHNKSRNRRGTKKAEDLVYIYTNTRLLRGRLGADLVRWYENNVFSEDEDESVNDDSDRDDGDDDDNLNGGEGMEGNEPINDDERSDGEGPENIVAEDGAGVFDWNEIDAKIEQENRDRAERVAAHEGEESDRSYSPAPCNDRSSKDIEDTGHFNLGENNGFVEQLNNEDDTVVGDDNGNNNMTGRVDKVVAPVIENSAPHGRMEIGSSSNSVPTIDSNIGDDNGNNNMTGRVDKVVAPVIENSAPHGRMEIGSSSNSVPTIDSNSVENADSSRRSVHVEQVDVESPSMSMTMPRNIREERGKGTIGTRIIGATRAAVATVIGGGRETEENVVLEVNSNQNTMEQLDKMRSNTVVIRDGTDTSRDGPSLDDIPHPSSVPEREQRGTTVDVISLGRPPRPHRPVLQSGVVPLEVQSVSRSIETATTSMRRGPTVIGGRLK